MNDFKLNNPLPLLVILLLAPLCHTLSSNEAEPIGLDYNLIQKYWDDKTFTKSFINNFLAQQDLEPKITESEQTLYERTTPLLEEGNFKLAVSVLESNQPSGSSAAFDFTIGTLALQTKDLEKAKNHLLTAVKKHPTFLRAYKSLGMTCIQLDDLPLAVKSLLKAIELGDKDPATVMSLGYCYLQLGYPASAEISYKQAFLHLPGNTQIIHGLVSALLQMERFDETIPLLEETIKNKPQERKYWLAQVDALNNSGKTDDALINLESVRRLNNITPNALILLGDLYLIKELPTLALEVYSESLLYKNPASFSRLFRSASQLTQSGEPEASIKLIHNIEHRLKISESENNKLLSLKSDNLLSLGKYDEAFPFLKSTVSREPMNGRAIFQLARYYVFKKDTFNAEFYFQQAEKIDSIQRKALIAHAKLLIEERELKKAAALLEKAQFIKHESYIEKYLNQIKQLLKR